MPSPINQMNSGYQQSKEPGIQQNFNTTQQRKSSSIAFKDPSSIVLNIVQQSSSILVKLQQSLNQKPTFDQLMLVQLQKKHLWQLLALKEEHIEKLQIKSKQAEFNLFQLNQQNKKKDQSIAKALQTKRQLENQLQRVLQIKENIVEELNLVKQLYNQQEQFDNKSRKIMQNIVQINRQTNPANAVLETNEVESIKQLNKVLLKQKQKLQKKLSILEQINKASQEKIKNLKNQFDEVLTQLKTLKVQVIEKFDLTKQSNNNTKRQSANTKINQSNKQNIKYLQNNTLLKNYLNKRSTTKTKMLSNNNQSFNIQNQIQSTIKSKKPSLIANQYCLPFQGNLCHLH